MFIGRKNELNILEKLYSSNSLQIIHVAGERNIGKTALLKNFARHKKTIYFCVRQALENANKSSFCAEVREQINIVEAKSYDWIEILEQICHLSCGEKIVFIVDNAHYLQFYFSSFMDEFFKILLNFGNKLRLTIIMSGRDDWKIPENNQYAGFPVTEIMLNPVSFLEAGKFLTGFNIEDRVLLYGITGGYPCYLQYIDNNVAVKDNLYNLFYNQQALLLNEPNVILLDKLREPSTYNSILCSVACGAVRVNEIAEAVGMECNKLSKYLNVLLRLRIIKRIVPVTEQNEKRQHKKTYYKLSNTMLDFWYQFVFPYLSLIAMNKGAQILRNKVLPKLGIYCAMIFNDICLQQCKVLMQRKNFMFDFQWVGSYWDNKIAMGDKVQLAYNSSAACFIKCDWNRQKTDIDVLQRLEEDIRGLQYTRIYYLLFSRKGFTDRLLNYSANNSDVRLISLQYLK